MKAIKEWSDPIVEEVRQIRKKLEAEYEKDPDAFFDEAQKVAQRAGIQYADIKPLPFPGSKKAESKKKRSRA